MGYNEPRAPSTGEDNIRTGSHNVVVGQRHNFSRFGGLVVGDFNTISGDFAVVSGGTVNTASGDRAAVSGGTATRPAGECRRSAAGPATRPAAIAAVVSGGGVNGGGSGTCRPSGEVIRPAACSRGQRRVRQHGQRRLLRRSAAGEATPETARAGNTASGGSPIGQRGSGNTASGLVRGQRRAEPDGRRASSTGSPAPSSKTTRGLDAGASRSQGAGAEGGLCATQGGIGFPEESEKFCTLDEVSLVNNHFQVLPKRAAHLRIGASASHVASTSVDTSQLAGSKTNV